MAAARSTTMFVSWNGVVDVVIGVTMIAWRRAYARSVIDFWEGRRLLGIKQFPHPEERLDYERSGRRACVAVGIIFIISGVRSLLKQHM
jgi:hypothetical protein